MKCEICGEEFKNLGSHKFAKHGIAAAITVDEHLSDKQLSSLISEMRTILKPYVNELTVKTIEAGGSVKEIEITARIQLRR